MALVAGVYITAGGGVMILPGQPLLWPVFAALGVVAALAVLKRMEAHGVARQYEGRAMSLRDLTS
jgi:hypothetical protein